MSIGEAMDVLGLREGFSEAELTRAYRTACLVNHPDKPGGSDEMFVRVKRAKDILSDASRPSRYDENVQSDTLEVLKFFIWLLACVIRSRLSCREPRVVRVTVTMGELYDACVKRIEYTRIGLDGIRSEREVLFLELLDYRSEYVIPNKGDNGGDLHLIVDVCADDEYRLDDLEEPHRVDLHRGARISIFEYYYGVSRHLRLPNGEEIELSDFVPRRDGTVRVIPERGLPREGGDVRRGDLYVVYDVDLGMHDPPESDREEVRRIFFSGTA